MNTTIKRKAIPQSLTKSELRQYALIQLRAKGYKVWIQNNIAVRGRKFIGERGVPDIIGYRVKDVLADGTFIGCEVKTKGDILSKDQKMFLTNLRKAGGLSYLVIEERGSPKVVPYQ